VKNLFPALAIFGVAALGAMALANTMNGRLDHTDAKPALAESAETAAETPVITAHQVRTASLRKEGDGHFWATAYVNKRPVKFLVDTGASLVALTREDARKIGLNTDTLKANTKVRTAAGQIDAALATVDVIEIDGVTIKNVSAVVIEKGLEHSLLGMSFLNRLQGWDVTANAIVIRQ
jgi:aspartyl protease family protein